MIPEFWAVAWATAMINAIRLWLAWMLIRASVEFT